METTIITAPVTDTTATGVDVFFNDVVQYNEHSAGFLSSVSHYFNAIVNFIKSCIKYVDYISDAVDAIFTGGYFPPVLVTMCTVSIVFMWYYFVRNRG